MRWIYNLRGVCECFCDYHWLHQGSDTRVDEGVRQWQAGDCSGLDLECDGAGHALLFLSLCVL